MTLILNILLVSLPIKKIETSLSNQPWIFLTLLFVLFLLSLLFNYRNLFLLNELKHLFQTAERSFRQFSNEKKQRFSSSLIFNIFSIIVLSLYIYIVFYGSFTVLNISKFSILCLVTTAFYLLKYFLFKILGYVFSKVDMASYFSDVYFQLLGILTLILYPLLILYFYLPLFNQTYLIISSVFAFALFFIFLIIKLYQSFFVKRIALFYMFLYLCSVEIMPLFILFRIYSVFL